MKVTAQPCVSAFLPLSILKRERVTERQHEGVSATTAATLLIKDNWLLEPIFRSVSEFHTSETLAFVLALRGAWWLRAERQARMRWMAPISRAMRRSSTPSSVVSGVLLNSARRTWNGSVGSTLADGDCRI